MKSRKHPSLRIPLIQLWNCAEFILVLGLFISCGGGSAPANSGGSDSSTAPSGLQYPVTEIAGVVGQAIQPALPTVSGTVTKFEASASLPPGLILDSATGRIQGTPMVPMDALPIVITARNTAGISSITLRFRVDQPSPVPLLFCPSKIFTGEASVFASLPLGSATDITWGILSGTATGSLLAGSIAPLMNFSAGETPGSFQVQVQAKDASSTPISLRRTVDVIHGAFLKESHVPSRRNGQTATVLQDGRVLVAGGTFSNHDDTILAGTKLLASTDIYDPATNTWAQGENMLTPRSLHTATLLADGRVLVTGGIATTSDTSATVGPEAEIYNPATNTWVQVGSLAQARCRHAAVRLKDGKVLVAGGQDFVDSSGLNSCEIFDPLTLTFSPTGSLNFHRFDMPFTLLGDGRVLAAGGYSSETWDPSSGAWTSIAAPSIGWKPRAVLLPNGQVLVVDLQMSMETFDPVRNKWSSTTWFNRGPWMDYSISLLKNGRVLIVGGTDGQFQPVKDAVIFDPAASTWAIAEDLGTPHVGHSAVTLLDGRVLVTGGYLPGGEIYDPSTNQWANTSFSVASRIRHSSTRLQDDRILLAGGIGWLPRGPSDIFDPVTGAWSSTGPMITPRINHTATLLQNGHVVLAGGTTATYKPINATEEFNPTTGLWTTVGAMKQPRYAHRAVILPNGRVLVVGGTTDLWNGIASCEIFDPVTGQWASTGPMTNARYDPAVVVLADGRVLAIGGKNQGDPWADVVNLAEIYNPVNGTWSPAAAPIPVTAGPANDEVAIVLSDGRVLLLLGQQFGAMTAQVFNPITETWTLVQSPSLTRNKGFSLTLLADGQVLLAGGAHQTYAFSDEAEVYDPRQDTWTVQGPLHEARAYHTAELLRNGKVVILGGMNACVPEYFKP